MNIRRPAFAAFFIATALLSSATLHAQQWPAKPVRIIMPYPSGGSFDSLARLMADKLTQRLKQPFLIENKPGGLTLIGTNEVTHAAPDGYTLLMNANVITLLHLTVKTDFDVTKDLLPITKLRGGMDGFWVSAALPVSNIKELIAYAKANPGKLNYASNGIGSNQHIDFELFKEFAGGGFDAVQVPYKGEAPIIQALVTNEVQIYLASFLQLSEQYKAGRLKLLGVGGDHRSKQFPDVPTYREQGVPFTQTYWSGYFAPAKTSMDIARKLQTELKAIYQLPDVYPIMTRNDEDLGGETPEEFRKQILIEVENAERVIKRVGIKPQ